MKTTRIALIGLLACGSSLPFLIGADGGCGAFTSTTPAPDVTGKWAISYGNTIAVKVTIGGSVYSQNLSASGGNFSITHQGKPYSFNLDCARPEVVCPKMCIRDRSVVRSITGFAGVLCAAIGRSRSWWDVSLWVRPWRPFPDEKVQAGPVCCRRRRQTELVGRPH